MTYLITNIVIIIILYVANNIKNKEIIRESKNSSFISKLKLIGLIFIGEKVDLNNVYIRFIYTKMIKLYGKKEALLYAKIHFSENFLILLLSNFVISIILMEYEADISFWATSILVILLILFINYKEISKKVIKRNNMIKMQFPILANSLLLLMEAGLETFEAWKQICKINKDKNLIFIEANKTIDMFNYGLNKEEAFLWFSDRCGIAEISRFISAFLNCMENGTDEMKHLRLLVEESWEMQKQTVKYSSEKMATKMMLPISMMFISTIILVAAPGVISLLKN